LWAVGFGHTRVPVTNQSLDPRKTNPQTNKQQNQPTNL
jgi:hypothetical protein